MKKTLLISVVISAIFFFSCEKESIDKSCTGAPSVFAGNDTTLNKTTLNLNGISSDDKGEWSILSGEGGTINSSGSSVQFVGKLKNTYKLKWESENNCGTASDTITITMKMDCGSDLTVAQMVENIHWVNQSCFKIIGSQYKIYTDPLSISQNDTADLILVTHNHGDHFSADDINKLTSSKTTIITPGDCSFTGSYAKLINLLPDEEYTFNECIKIKAVPAYNITKTQYHPKSNNWVGYLITINGVTIYHAGDTERIPEMKDIHCDIALLPLGQTYTMNSVSDAAESAKDAHAEVAIPMHFDFYEGTLEDAQTFKELLQGRVNVVIKTKEQ